MIAINRINGRWWAVGGVSVVLVALAARTCERPGQQTSIVVAVARHDSASGTMAREIRRQREIAAAAAKTESVEIVHAHTRPPSRQAFPEPPAGLPLANLAADDSALAAAGVQITALGTALDLSELRAASADSLLHYAVRVMVPQCRIVRILPCPSRIATAVGSATGTVIALAFILRK